MRRASVLLFALLVGCAATPAAVTPTAPAATAGAVASASRAPRGVYSLPPPNYPTVAPSPTHVVPSPTKVGNGVTVKGTVYNKDGLPLWRSSMTIQSIDPTHPYSDAQFLSQGTFSFTDVPKGIQLKLTATCHGYEPRSITLTATEAETLADFKGDTALANLLGN